MILMADQSWQINAHALSAKIIINTLNYSHTQVMQMRSWLYLQSLYLSIFKNYCKIFRLLMSLHFGTPLLYIKENTVHTL